MEFELPADLTTLSVEELRALRSQAVDLFRQVRASDEAASSIAELRALRDATRELNTELQRRDAESAATEAELAEMDAEFSDDASADDADEGDEAEADDDEDEQDGESLSSEGDLEVDGDDESEGVQASAPRRISLPAVANRQPATPDPVSAPAARAQLTAAAGMPGHDAGDELNLQQFADSLIERLPALRPGGPGKPTQVTLGQIDIPFPDDLTVRGNDATEVTEYAAQESRLQGNSLTAAGGWCAPGEILYDLCPGLETDSGMISVPEVLLTRGSAQFFGGFDFNDVFSDGFCFTNEQDIAGEYAPGAAPGDPNEAGPKPCITVPCLEPETVTLGGCGLCIQTGLLQARAFPESIRRFIEVSLVAHRHRINADLISKMEAAATAVTMPASNGATAHVLGSLELMIEHLRHKYRMSPSASMEVVLPYWLRGALRSDLAKRLGVALTNVSNQDLTAHFTRRGAMIQWVYDWQDNAVDASYAIGGDTIPTTWPDQVKILIYPAGTYVKWTGGQVRIDMIVDQDLVLNNNRHELFLEEFYELTPRCHEAIALEVPLCPDGSTQGGIDLSCEVA